jgi:hypothetical protein
MPNMEGHHHFLHFCKYMNSLATVLKEIWAQAPDPAKYAEAAAIVHCILDGLLFQYVAISVYENAAFDHVLDFLDATLAQNSSTHWENGNGVWKGPFTGTWGAGEGLVATHDKLLKEALEVQRPSLQEADAAFYREAAAAATKAYAEKSLRVQQAAH